MNLEEMQRWFGGLLTQPFRETGAYDLPVYPPSIVEQIRERIAPSPTLTPEQRFAIYNQQYWWRLFVLMQEYFPTLVRLFGFHDFNTFIAEPYLQRYPPTDWFLPNLGEHLVRFVREEYDEKDRFLVAQAAEIDFAYERLFHVGSKPTITSETSVFFLQPYVQLFELSADFFAFRSLLLEKDVAYWQDHDLPKLHNAKPKYFFLLYRTSTGMLYEEMEQEPFVLLKMFEQGATLDEACGHIIQTERITDWFKTWTQKKLLGAGVFSSKGK